MNWSKTYTSIDNVNNGQEFENGDYPTKEAFNVALNNTEYLKQNQDSQATSISNIEQRLNDLGFKQGYFDAFITYIEEDEEGEEYETTQQIPSSSIGINTLTREGNRIFVKFWIGYDVLTTRQQQYFRRLRLISHGNGVSDNYFKFKTSDINVETRLTLLINYSNYYYVQLSVNASVRDNEINFTDYNIELATDWEYSGSTSVVRRSVNSFYINNIGLEAK